MEIKVVNTKSVINVPSVINCTKGGLSIPLMVST
jgi:hypothetical protein